MVSAELQQQLESIVQHLMRPGRGILAADESNGSANKRLMGVGIEQTEEERRKWRQFLLTEPGTEEYLSGVILYDETIRQASDEGMLFRKDLEKRDIMPGIKVDMGLSDLALHEGEQWTTGLDGLRGRFAEYAAMGAKFAKWRAVYHITDELPSKSALITNAQTLAQYAALAQEAGIVPIVEPEVLLSGTHTIERCAEVTQRAQAALFMALTNLNVHMPGLILKASMVIAGKDSEQQADVKTVASETVRILKSTCPDDLGGVVFLSGGQAEVEATAHLHMMLAEHKNLPWGLTYSYSRAIQNPVLDAYAAGDHDKAKAAYHFRLKANALASKGEWSPEYEADAPY